jgi:hypothetical protein
MLTGCFGETARGLGHSIAPFPLSCVELFSRLGLSPLLRFKGGPISSLPEISISSLRLVFVDIGFGAFSAVTGAFIAANLSELRVASVEANE